MFVSDSIDFVYLLNGDIFAQSEVLNATFQSKHHRFAHTGVGGLLGEPETEVEFYVSRNFNDTAFYHENVWTLLRYAHAHVPRTGDIAYNRAGSKMFRKDEFLSGRTNRDDRVRLTNIRDICGCRRIFKFVSN